MQTFSLISNIYLFWPHFFCSVEALYFDEVSFVSAFVFFANGVVMKASSEVKILEGPAYVFLNVFHRDRFDGLGL